MKLENKIKKIEKEFDASTMANCGQCYSPGAGENQEYTCFNFEYIKDADYKETKKYKIGILNWMKNTKKTHYGVPNEFTDGYLLLYLKSEQKGSGITKKDIKKERETGCPFYSPCIRIENIRYQKGFPLDIVNILSIKQNKVKVSWKNKERNKGIIYEFDLKRDLDKCIDLSKRYSKL